ncbi:heme-binding protein [Marinomonas arenicola]|uniref:Heme-binding protein n=1 Tax=Marinomonas arenicola TaxID=569601 RepID=A0ABU9G9Q5_9GAMM
MTTNQLIVPNNNLSTRAAIELCDSAMTAAEQLHITICVAIVCPAGNVLASINMNCAPLLSAKLAHKKAYTAVSFKQNTYNWQEKLANKPQVLDALLSEPMFTYLGGGLPIFIEQQLVGAIGVSGGSEQQDISCALKAIATLLPN